MAGFAVPAHKILLSLGVALFYVWGFKDWSLIETGCGFFIAKKMLTGISKSIG